MKDLHVGVVPYFEDYNVKENENRELIRDLLKLSDKTLLAIGRPGMTGEGRKVAEHYVEGGEVEIDIDAGWVVEDTILRFVSKPGRYRIKKKMILVNGIEVPAPETEAPEMGREYYVPDPAEERYVSMIVWEGDEYDHVWFARNLVYLDKDDCIQRAEAMIKYEVIEC